MLMNLDAGTHLIVPRCNQTMVQSNVRQGRHCPNDCPTPRDVGRSSIEYFTSPQFSNFFTGSSRNCFLRHAGRFRDYRMDLPGMKYSRSLRAIGRHTEGSGGMTVPVWKLYSLQSEFVAISCDIRGSCSYPIKPRVSLGAKYVCQRITKLKTYPLNTGTSLKRSKSKTKSPRYRYCHQQPLRVSRFPSLAF